MGDGDECIQVADGTGHRRNCGGGLEVGRHQAHAEEHPLGRVEGHGDICWPREVTDDDVGAQRPQGIGAVVVVVRHRSYGLVALTQQRDNLAADAADSAAGAVTRMRPGSVMAAVADQPVARPVRAGSVHPAAMN